MFNGRDLDYTENTSESNYLVTKVFMNNNYREIIYQLYEASNKDELIGTISFFQNPDGVFSHGEFWKDIDLNNSIVKRLIKDKASYELLKEKGFIKIDDEDVRKSYYLDVARNLKRLELSSSIINDIDNVIEENQYLNAEKRLIDICKELNQRGISCSSTNIKSMLDKEINKVKFEDYNENTVIRNIVNENLKESNVDDRNAIVTNVLHEVHSELCINKELLNIKDSINNTLIDIYDYSHLAESLEEIERTEEFVVLALESNREYVNDLMGKEKDQNV
ncbi:MAG: hypothetical protein N4A47_04145 [Clostridia bacterium]|jgi:hypothetical protein|nr:hypothetical protein [Clostridia bacterium]